jgi:hypothetical protein
MSNPKETHKKTLQKGKQRGESAGAKTGPKVNPFPKSASARVNAMKEKYGVAGKKSAKETPKVESNLKKNKPGK